MTKVSKNIKRLRSDRKMTQTDLAEQIHITRQAVSSWESGRTQPDIEMLKILSEIFDVSLEELIYGEKRNTTIDNSNKTQISTGIIVLSVLGSLLITVGAILIIGYYWYALPKFVKGIFAFIPMLAGQAMAVFTLTKKKDSIPLRESSALVWMAGVAATIALANSVFVMKIDFRYSLMIDMILFIPIIWIMKSVSATLSYFATAIIWSFYAYEYFGFVDYFSNTTPISSTIIITAILAAFISIGIIFTIYNKKQLGAVRYDYAKWFCTIAVIASTIIAGMSFDMNILIVSMALSIALFAMAKKDDPLTSPFMFIGTIGCVAFSTIGGLGLMVNFGYEFHVINLLALIAPIIGIAIGRSTFKDKNIIKIVQTALMGLMLIINIWFNGSSVDDIYFFTMPLALIIAVTFIVQGAIGSKLLPINLGLISICVLIIGLMLETELNLLTLGITMLIFGIVLLAINIKFLAKKKKLKEIHESEVTANE